MKSFRFSIIVLSMLLLASGCATQGSPQVQQTIPPDSPLAQIRKGMGNAEVMHLLGPPTDQEFNLTGKVFIPFYFGGGQSITRYYYKGLGRIYIDGEGMFGGGGGVAKIEYDPQESGFRK